MIIICDVDDVIVKFCDRLVERIDETFSEYDKPLCFSLESITDWKWPVREYPEAIDWFKDPEFYRDLELYEENVKVVKEWARLYPEDRIYIVTACHPNAAPLRAEWFVKTFPEFELAQLVFCQHKHLLQGDIIVDDRLETVLRHPAKYRFLVDRPWNREDGEGDPVDIGSAHRVLELNSVIAFRGLLP